MHDIGVSNLSTPRSTFIASYSKVIGVLEEDICEFVPLNLEMSAVERNPSEKCAIVSGEFGPRPRIRHHLP